jgi:hypothetical protein
MLELSQKIQEIYESDKTIEITINDIGGKGFATKIDGQVFLTFILPKNMVNSSLQDLMEQMLRMNAKQFLGKPYYFAWFGEEAKPVLQLRITQDMLQDINGVVHEFVALYTEILDKINYNLAIEVEKSFVSLHNQHNDNLIVKQKQLFTNVMSGLIPEFQKIFVYSELNQIGSLPLSDETPLLIVFNENLEKVPFSVICGQLEASVAKPDNYQKFLSANFNGSATNHAVFGLTSFDDIIVLNHDINFHQANQDEVATEICNLLENGETWSKQITIQNHQAMQHY